MNFYPAVKTLKAFNDAVEFDQGATYRTNLKSVLPHLEDAYRGKDDAFRNHMGASLIGKKCARAIWYGFRWATVPHFDGRMLRLFNRGHLEEGRIIALFLSSGVQIYQQDQNGRQFKISMFGEHFGGSGDGVAVNIPDLTPGMPCLTEYKTHNDKSFSKVASDGVKEAKWEHYVQSNLYSYHMGLGVAIYCAVNKNDDHIHAELLATDVAVAREYTDRAYKIIPIHAPPPKISNSPGWFECKFCDHRPVCHLNAEPAVNCRTCEWVRPDMEKGGFWCDNKERQMKMLFGPSPGVSEEGETFQLSKARQLTGCAYYSKNSKL